MIQKGNIPIVIAPGIRGHKKVVWYFNNETGQIISPRTDIRTDDFNGFYVVAESIFEMIEQASHMISQTASRINQGIFHNPTELQTKFILDGWQIALPRYESQHQIL